MPFDRTVFLMQSRLNALRTGFADLAFDLERQGRFDAADVVMQIDTRVRDLAAEIAREESATFDENGQFSPCPPPANFPGSSADGGTPRQMR